MASNNTMAMMFMLLLVGGAIVAFVKRCEWFKMCDDKKFKQDVMPSPVRFRDWTAGGKLDKTVKDDLEVTVPQGDGSLKVYNPQSKFARISYF